MRTFVCKSKLRLLHGDFGGGLLDNPGQHSGVVLVDHQQLDIEMVEDLGGGLVEDLGGGDQFVEHVVRTAPCGCNIFPDIPCKHKIMRKALHKSIFF